MEQANMNKKRKAGLCIVGSGVYALRLTWWRGKERKDKGCGVFTRLKAVRRLRSDMW